MRVKFQTQLEITGLGDPEEHVRADLNALLHSYRCRRLGAREARDYRRYTKSCCDGL